MRKLWTEQSVTFSGKYHQVIGAGLAPLPGRSIPLWIGTNSDVGYRRAGRLADGWFPMMGVGPHLDHARAVVDAAAVEAGREPADLGMEGRVNFTGDVDAAAAELAAWRAAGATHVSVNTMKAGLATVDDHLAALERVSQAASAS